jgi:hypothetical protein
MASETQMRPRPFPPGDAWPPDDTEESILGTDLHQTTITNLRWGINEVAHLRRTPGQPLPWQALSQIALLGCERPDGSAYRTFPDVVVYPHPIDPGRGSLTLAVDGPPVLIIEVLSESTFEADIDLVRGKATAMPAPASASISHSTRPGPSCRSGGVGGVSWTASTASRSRTRRRAGRAYRSPSRWAWRGC